MHACIQKIYFVLKDNGECSSEERRGNLYSISSFSVFLVISSLIVRCLAIPSQLYLRSLQQQTSVELPLWFSFNMGTKIKGICKYISNIFVEKEAELEIGGPTDVKHVAHIGWEGTSDTAPSWMREFKTGPEYAATTIGSNGSSLSPWSSQECMGNQKAAGHCMKDTNSPEPLDIPKPKQKRKKTRPTTSSPKSGSSSSSRSTRVPKSKTKFVDDNTKTLKFEVKPINIEVA